ncbi:set domain containing protein [Grosmannia clavigera kw1407]|uniref:Set domain containing protein n=1 Tax=Grosmannia clavigera (strain kw1407 / UAMH 11150) TaxID=655863 RepID=F0X881_GROCL|nr:set domain containing protein [Grosmannia clavigera kw1407]EFX05802.1 set domain containing protein [Grosmannia clavigera kw1407]
MALSISTLVRGAVVFALLPFLCGVIGTSVADAGLPAQMDSEAMENMKAYVSSQPQFSEYSPAEDFTFVSDFTAPQADSIAELMPTADIGFTPVVEDSLEPENQTAVDILDSSHSNPADPKSWKPWTHPPECGVASSYCVFTQTTLPASGRGILDSNNMASNDTSPQGISIITTPEQAAYSLNPLELSFAPEFLEIYKKFADLPPAFAVHQHPTSPLKGDGLFATRSIRAGEPVIVDRPALLAHFKVMTDEMTRALGSDEDDHGLGPETDSDRTRMWNAAAERLPPHIIDRIYNMTVLPRYNKLFQMLPAEDFSPENAPPVFSHIEKVFASNSFAMTVKGYAYKALFPNVAKINHDCRPNLSADIFGETMTMVVWANRDIEEGEELTISYLNDLLPSDRRSKVIKRRWDFQCQCDLCTGKADGALEASDKRLQHIPSLIGQIARDMADSHADKALEAALDLRAIYIGEGLMRETTTTEKMLLLPEMSEEERDRVKDDLMADPFGPAGLAKLLGRLYLANGKEAEALPYLRAAVTEIGRQTFAWPNPEKMAEMWHLVQLVEAAERKVDKKRKWFL